MILLVPPLLAFAGATAAGPATPPAVNLRIASAFDPQTMDPHALALLYHSRVVSQIYESLVGRDADFRLEPALATAWRMTAPTTWRFQLRPNVVFHDGSAFGADDVVFSLGRALVTPSQRAFQLKGIKAVRKVDGLTVDIELEAPDAVLPEKLDLVAMMSKAWCTDHAVLRAQDFNGQQETFAVRHANGTGPFRLDRFEPDVRTLLARNPRWWGWGDRRSGNIDSVSLVPIRSDATRLAALVSGEIDVVLDPPMQDVERLKQEPAIRLLQTTDLGQQYLAFDQARPELAESDIKGRNPFRDLRVRRAVYQAINVELIARKVLHGLAVPTGAFLSPRVDGSPPELDRRLPFDPARARALLAEAGYPGGFSIGLDCVNVAWREAVCQAVAAMLTQVGIRTQLHTAPTNQFFPKLTGGTTGFAEFGWSPTPDAWSSLNALFRSFDGAGSGTFNAGRYRNPDLDSLIDRIRIEPDAAARRALIGSALRQVEAELPLVPLYRRTLTWAVARRFEAVIWPNDTLELRWVRMK